MRLPGRRGRAPQSPTLRPRSTLAMYDNDPPDYEPPTYVVYQRNRDRVRDHTAPPRPPGIFAPSPFGPSPLRPPPRPPAGRPPPVPPPSYAPTYPTTYSVVDRRTQPRPPPGYGDSYGYADPYGYGMPP